MKNFLFSLLFLAQSALAVSEPVHMDSFVATNASAIGSKANPDSKAVLDLVSTTLGFLPPRLTTTQVNAIASPTEGLSVYNITDHKLTYYDGTAWREGTAGGLITNADVAAGAGIVYSKLSLTGGIVNADINNTAAIAYSKLALTGSILNADLAGSIADSKLLTISTAGKVSNSATTATDANTASAIVARDASGNFTAGTITAALTGAASGNTTITPVNHGVVLSTGTNALNTVAVGGTGKVLQGVALSDPVWSTATYPGTATTTGTILRANGTNWVASTATYPDTVTNKNLLVATAANVVGSLNSTATSAVVTSSASVPSMASGATANRLLRTDGTTVSFAQAALATDVSGTLAIANGGTNNGSLSVTGGTVYYADGTKMVGLANGSSGQVLTSAGTTLAPTWASAPSPVQTVQSKTANYTALSTDDVILGNTNAFTVTLYAASAGSKPLRVCKVGTDTNLITISRAGSDTIAVSGGTVTSTALHRSGECITLTPDGTSKFYLDHEERTERAVINISSSTVCSITSQSGSWFSGCSAAGGVATLTIQSGVFSAAPTCSGSAQSTGVARMVDTVGTSATQVLMTGYDVSGLNQTGSYSVICMGPR